MLGIPGQATRLFQAHWPEKDLDLATSNHACELSRKQTNLYAWVTDPHLLGLVIASVGLRNPWSGRRSDALANKQVLIVTTRAR